MRLLVGEDRDRQFLRDSVESVRLLDQPPTLRKSVLARHRERRESRTRRRLSPRRLERSVLHLERAGARNDRIQLLQPLGKSARVAGILAEVRAERP
jgi:hypothetical protein